MLNKKEIEFLAQEILGREMVKEFEYLGKRIVEGMKEELLREDERCYGRISVENTTLLRHRLIEEREKRTKLESQLIVEREISANYSRQLAEMKEELDERQQTSWKQTAILWQEKFSKLQAELAEAREKSARWEEEAQQYSQNSDYWRARAEKAENELVEMGRELIAAAKKEE